MPVAEVHPSAEELAAFTLATLDEEALACVEAHVAACPSCQERAAVAPADTLVALLRSAHARADRAADTVPEATLAQTPAPHAAPAGIVTVGLLAPAATEGRPEDQDAVPPALARHERYRVVRLLGAGGMGAVFEAEHRVMQRPVALKVINRACTASAAALERFRREIRAAARLSHPNIVTTYDAEDAGATHFLVMEYVEGTDLGRLVQKRGPLPVDRACEYARQAALGLQHAFEQGMVHRDLKPHNLMLTPDGRVIILDFGLACFASEAASAAGVTGTGLVLGTVDYIAPEQADNPHEADTRSDIYSLGCTLYHLLAGRPPFPTGTALQKVMAHMEKNPQPLTELRPDLPEGFMLVLERMMSKDPSQRYQTPAEVALALEPFTLAPAVARAPRPRPHARTTGSGRTVVLAKTPIRDRKRPRLAVATAILAFLVAGLLGVGVYRIATDNGELVIETKSDDVEVVIRQGGRVVMIIDTKTGKHVTLRSGEYELGLKDGQKGLSISPDKITIKRGKTELATITREDKPGLVPPPRGLVAWWRADGNAKDSAGAHHGTLKGGVKFAPGVAGQAFDFNGIDGRIDVGNAPSLHLSSRDFTVSAWVNFRSLKRPPRIRNNPPGDMGIVCKIFAGGDDGWSLLKQDDNHFWFGFGGGDINGLRADAPTTIRSTTSAVPGVWYHVVAVKTAADFSLYVNGIKEASKPLPAFKDTNTADLLLGNSTNNDCYMAGLIDEVKIYSRALSPAEVKAHWSALAPAPKPDAEKVGLVRRFLGHAGGVWDVALSADGSLALSVGGHDQTARLWKVATGEQLYCFKGLREDNLGVAFSPDSRTAFCSSGGEVRSWDVATGKEHAPLRSQPDCARIRSLAISDDGRKLLAGGVRAAVLFDVQTGKELQRLDKSGWIHSAALSRDATQILTGADVPTEGCPPLMRLWDAKTGQEIRRFAGPTGRIHEVAFSPDGKRCVSCGAFGDDTLRVFDMASGKELFSIPHPGWIGHGAFLPDGQRFLTACGDGVVYMWDVRNGQNLHSFKGHKGQVNAVAVSRDGRYALTGGMDKTLRLWRLPDLPPAMKQVTDSGLIKNGGFEAGLEGWVRWSHGPSQFEFDRDVVREGRQSLRVTASNPDDCGCKQHVQLKPRQWYRFSGWVRTRGIKVHGASRRDSPLAWGTIVIFGIHRPSEGPAWPILARGDNHSGDTEWTRISLRFQAPDDGIAGICLCPAAFARVTGTVWFDGLKLVEENP